LCSDSAAEFRIESVGMNADTVSAPSQSQRVELGSAFCYNGQEIFYVKKSSMYGMNRDKVCLLPHDPAWRDDFLAEKHRIETVLQDSSVQIEPVGSTSIPTVHAKLILDLAILCGEQGVDPVAEALTALGYTYRGLSANRSGHYYAVRERDNIRFVRRISTQNRSAIGILI